MSLVESPGAGMYASPGIPRAQRCRSAARQMPQCRTLCDMNYSRQAFEAMA